MESSRDQAEREWLAEQLQGLTTTIRHMSPSECLEAKRYLPSHNSPKPGPFRFRNAPHMREIVDCFDVRSPITHVDVMKGVQVNFTTCVLEGGIFYSMVEVRTATTFLVTSTDDLARKRIDNFVVPMIQSSDIEDLVASNDEGNKRKTGRRAMTIEWVGGGLLVASGAQSPNAMRSLPMRFVLGDEVDSWPLRVGKDGDSVAVVEGRTKSFPQTKKVVRGSTPLIAESSLIAREYEKGDQREYYVRCLGCGESQPVRWRVVDDDTGLQIGGIVWEIDPDNPAKFLEDSVRWKCQYCGHLHREGDKVVLFLEEGYGADPGKGARWVPTAIPEHPNRRSYHAPALISPAGFQTWVECVRDWFAAWDEANNRPRDLEKLQAFYNLILGLPFEDPTARKLRVDQVSPHRRAYMSGTVPNRWLVERATGYPVGLVICTVDVHATWLAVASWGFTRGERQVLLEYQRFPSKEDEKVGVVGDCTKEDDPETWGRLSEYVIGRRFEADDGKVYPIVCTAIDAGYERDPVFTFVHRHTNTLALFGRKFDGRDLGFKYFREEKNPHGLPAYLIHVDAYKDRIHASLQIPWDGIEHQPPRHWNAPRDITDAQLKELTVESKREVLDSKTGAHKGWMWHRPNGARNELFDLSVYACATLDLLALEKCPVDPRSGEFVLNFPRFWDICEGKGGSPPPHFEQT